MSIWSRLFRDPMKPLTEAIIKVVRQDGFGISGYVTRSSDDAILKVCKLEFFYFYLSYVEQIAQGKLDAAKFTSFNLKLKASLRPQIVDSIIGTDNVPLSRRTTEFFGLRKGFIDDVEKMTEPYRIGHRIGVVSEGEKHAGTPIPLQMLALKLASISGNDGDERFEEFHPGVLNLVSYDLVNLGLESLVEVAIR